MKRKIKKKSKIFYIGILVANQRERKKFLRLYRRFVPRNAVLYAFIPGSVRENRKWVPGLRLKNQAYLSGWFPLPHVVYNRCYGTSLPIPDEIRGHKLLVFNRRNQLDKEETDHILRSSAVSPYLPDTALAHPETVRRMLEQYGAVILKPSLGNRGNGVYRLGITETRELHISQHHFAPFRIVPDLSGLEAAVAELTGSGKYLVQQWISTRPVDDSLFDIRVLVQKSGTGEWGVTNVISRVTYEGCFNSSMSKEVRRTEELLGRVLPPDRLSPLMQSIGEISLLAASEIEGHSGGLLGELSIDFGIGTDDRLWIIEVNGQPQKSLYRELGLAGSVYKNPMEYARFLLTGPRG